MTRLVIPVASQPLWSTGDIKLWTEIELLLKDTAGNFAHEVFRVDTGTEITIFPAYLAKALSLPIPRNASPGAFHTQSGLEVRSGVLHFRVAGLDATEYATACLFLGDPDTPPDPNRPATFPRKLLQPYQLLEWLRFTLDKDPAGSLYGDLVMEKK